MIEAIDDGNSFCERGPRVELGWGMQHHSSRICETGDTTEHKLFL